MSNSDDKPLTPTEFSRQMWELMSDADPERAHVDMDDLMCSVLVSLGYREGIEHFYQQIRWYA